MAPPLTAGVSAEPDDRNTEVSGCADVPSHVRMTTTQMQEAATTARRTETPRRIRRPLLRDTVAATSFITYSSMKSTFAPRFSNTAHIAWATASTAVVSAYQQAMRYGSAGSYAFAVQPGTALAALSRPNSRKRNLVLLSSVYRRSSAVLEVATLRLGKMASIWCKRATSDMISVSQ